MNEAYDVKKVGKDLQIYGSVTGFAIQHFSKNTKYYQLSFKFFVDSLLIKVETSINDMTMHNKDDVINRINRIISEER